MVSAAKIAHISARFNCASIGNNQETISRLECSANDSKLHNPALGDIVQVMQHDTSTSTAVGTTNGAVQQPSAQSAAQGKLQLPGANTNVKASLLNPKATSDVAGKIIKPCELKATQQVLPPDTALREVQGQVITDTAKKDVSGQLRAPKSSF